VANEPFSEAMRAASMEGVQALAALEVRLAPTPWLYRDTNDMADSVAVPLLRMQNVGAHTGKRATPRAEQFLAAAGAYASHPDRDHRMARRDLLN